MGGKGSGRKGHRTTVYKKPKDSVFRDLIVWAGSKVASLLMAVSSVTYKLGRKIYLSGTYGKFTSRKIYDACRSSAGFDVIIGEKEFELKSGKTRFTEDERKILITIIKDTLSRSAPNDVYYEEDGEDKIYYHFYKDNNGDIYLVGVKYFKSQNIGFFETVYKTDIRNSHKRLKKLGDKK